jgi:YgiT-type zinc finger domain-containing protein
MCPTCHLGKLQMRTINYTQILDDRLLVIPNVSALVCDICGEKTFDREFLSRLSGLLSTTEGDPRPLTHLV